MVDYKRLISYYINGSDLTMGEKELMSQICDKLNWEELEALYSFCNNVFKMGALSTGTLDSVVRPQKSFLFPSTCKMLDEQTAKERLQSIADICEDWDGYRTARGLGALVNEIWALAAYPVKENKDDKKSLDF